MFDIRGPVFDWEVAGPRHDPWLVAALLRLFARLGSLCLFVVGVIMMGVGCAAIGIMLLVMFAILTVAWLFMEESE